MAVSKMDTRKTSAVEWSIPNPGKYQATMGSCFGLLRHHQHGMEDVTLPSLQNR